MNQHGQINLETISTSRKVAFLEDRKNYPENPARIDTKETHMSYLFLTPLFVYKLKKPVKVNTIDFTTPDARKFNCNEEVRLNKSLAPDVYIGVVALKLKNDQLCFDAEGVTIDWLVKMQRLDENTMLDRAIAMDTIDPELLEKAAVKLALFYKEAPAVDMDPKEYRKKLEERITINHRELMDPDFELPKDLLRKVYKRQLLFLNSKAGIFDQRLKEGRVIEAHGDLKPEHICLRKDPVIIDRLEFSKELRIQDCAQELAFLAVECELQGSEETGAIFFGKYEELTNDYIPVSLKNFYKSKQAALRTKFAIWHLKEPQYREDEKWIKKAHKSLALSKKYAELLNLNMANEPENNNV